MMYNDYISPNPSLHLHSTLGSKTVGSICFGTLCLIIYTNNFVAASFRVVSLNRVGLVKHRMAQYRSLVRRMTKDGSAYNIKSELKDSSMAAQKSGVHAVELVRAKYHAGFLKWLATIAAVYLLILDRTNWRTNMMTALLVPYIFLNSPTTLFNFFRGEVGRWIAFIAVVLRLFFPRHFPMWLELPGALVLLLVAAPNFLAHAFRNSIFAIIVSLLIGAYLLQQHIRAAGGFRNAFVEKHGISNTLGIIVLFVSPLWELINAL